MDLSAFRDQIQNNIIDRCDKALENLKETRKWHGYISRVTGLLLEAQLPGSTLGELCSITTEDGEQKLCEVVGFRGTTALMLCLEDSKGISQGCKVYPKGHTLQVGLCMDLLGRVIDAIGVPMDHKPAPVYEEFRDIEQPAPESFGRPRIHDIFSTGIRAVDGLLTLGVGQRVGLFAGSGVGKSTTMGMLARYTVADINVICLVGELWLGILS